MRFLICAALFFSLQARADRLAHIRLETGIPGLNFGGKLEVTELDNGDLHELVLDVSVPGGSPQRRPFSEMENGQDLVLEGPRGVAARLSLLQTTPYDPTRGGDFRLTGLMCSGRTLSFDFHLARQARNNQWGITRAGKPVRSIVIRAGVDVLRRQWRGCFLSLRTL